MYFSSKCAATGAGILSNLCAANFAYMLGEWPSSEHAYQFYRLRALGLVTNATRHEWTCGGKYANYDAITELGGKQAYWEKRQMIGIVAKMAADRLLKTHKIPKVYNKTSAWTLFMVILRAKFQPGTRAYDVLMATGGVVLIELGRSIHTKPLSKWASNPWCGYVDAATGTTYGLNWMGEFLMRLRDELGDAAQPRVTWRATATEPAISKAKAAKLAAAAASPGPAAPAKRGLAPSASSPPKKVSKKAQGSHPDPVPSVTATATAATTAARAAQAAQAAATATATATTAARAAQAVATAAQAASAPKNAQGPHLDPTATENADALARVMASLQSGTMSGVDLSMLLAAAAPHLTDKVNKLCNLLDPEGMSATRLGSVMVLDEPDPTVWVYDEGRGEMVFRKLTPEEKAARKAARAMWDSLGNPGQY